MSSIVFGLVANDVSLISGSCNFVSPSGVILRQDFDWITQIGESILFALDGDPSDCSYVMDCVLEKHRDHMLSFGRDIPCKILANYCRRLIAERLRSSTENLKVNILAAGWDITNNQPEMYWIDRVGALQKVSYGSHGPEFSSILSVIDHSLDSKNSSQISIEDGLNCINSCWTAIRQRSLRSIGLIKVFGVTSTGVKQFSLPSSEVRIEME